MRFTGAPQGSHLSLHHTGLFNTINNPNIGQGTLLHQNHNGGGMGMQGNLGPAESDR